MILEKFALTDRVAIVTGSGRGIGKGLALGLADAGAHVVSTARTLSEIEATAEEVRGLGRKALAVAADVREREQVEHVVRKAAEAFGRIDILVNNAGGTFVVNVLDMSEGQWDALVRENLKPVFLCGKEVGRIMARQQAGCIINISSAASHFGAAGLAPYAAAKAATNSLTRTLAAELAPFKVRVNAIVCGGVLTPGLKDTLYPTPESQADAVKNVLLARFGLPEDIALAAIYLASDAADWVTGQLLEVNGGLALSMA